MAQIPDRYVLSNMEIKVATTGSEHKGSLDGRSPHDLAIHQPLDVLQDGIAVVAGLAQPGIGVGAQHHGVRTVDADLAQLGERLCDSIRIGAHVGWKGHHRIAGALTDAADAGSSVAVE